MVWKNKGLKELWLFSLRELVLSVGVSKAKSLIKLKASFAFNNGSRHCIRLLWRCVTANKGVIEGGKKCI